MQSNLFRSTSRLINRYGRVVDYVVTTEGVYDVNTSSMSAETETESQIKAYKTKVSYSESQNPNLIGKDSAVYLIAGNSLNFTPDAGDRIVDDSDNSDYQVVVVSKVDLQGAVALWRLICVRS